MHVPWASMALYNQYCEVTRLHNVCLWSSKLVRSAGTTMAPESPVMALPRVEAQAEAVRGQLGRSRKRPSMTAVYDEAQIGLILASNLCAATGLGRWAHRFRMKFVETVRL